MTRNKSGSLPVNKSANLQFPGVVQVILRNPFTPSETNFRHALLHLWLFILVKLLGEVCEIFYDHTRANINVLLHERSFSSPVGFITTTQ